VNKLTVNCDYNTSSRWLNNIFNTLGVYNNYSLQSKIEFELVKFIRSHIENVDEIIVNIKNNADTMTINHIKPTYIKLDINKGKLVVHGVVKAAEVTCLGSNILKKGDINIGGVLFDSFTFMRGDVFNSEGLITGKNCLIETSVECSDLTGKFIKNQQPKLIGE
jgi:hypothetical protein